MAILARINYQIANICDLGKRFKKEKIVTISNYLDASCVLFLNEGNRDDVLHTLVDLLYKSGKLQDKEAFYQAILEREKIVSTGIGMGVAISHAKLTGYEDFFIAVGIQSRPGIEWNALDGNPVRLIFMIGGPDNRQTEYLKILSRLTTAIKDEQRRKKIFKAVSSQEVIDLFADC